MIDWLEIRQFAIADQVEIEFDPGLTTVTGETGSGKSLVVDAIGIDIDMPATPEKVWRALQSQKQAAE